MFADVVHQQGSDSPSVVCRCDGTVSLLPRCVPDLCLDGLCVYLDGSRGEFDADCGFGIEVELIACESTEEIRFADARVSDQDDCDWDISRMDK